MRCRTTTNKSRLSLYSDPLCCYLRLHQIYNDDDDDDDDDVIKVRGTREHCVPHLLFSVCVVPPHEH